MIVDIVSLPRRLARTKRKDAQVDSQQMSNLPISNLSRSVGYWEPHDDSFICVGGVHPVVTGKDAVFRYKFIEPTKCGIAEYFVVTSSPIDIGRPMFTKNVQLICPWVTLVDPKTMRTRKFILWEGVYSLIHFETEDNILDFPVEAVMLNELRNLAKLHGRPDLLEFLNNYPSDYKDVLISEERPDGSMDVDQLAMLGANIQAYNSMNDIEDPCHMCDVCDVFRGVDLTNMYTDKSPLKGCSFLHHVLYGPTTIKEVAHLFGMSYDVHAFQREFNDAALDKLVELSIYQDDNPDIFEILKCAERIPYEEYFLDISEKGECELKLRNHYDPRMEVPVPKDDPDISKLVYTIRDLFNRGFPGYKRAAVICSWGSEVYITLMLDTGKLVSYYFDLISASLGSRSLIRDYDGHMFV